ncbi:MAG: helix-turn-helix domain-containing protein [Verrucomicrobia bacterium]|nr:helix-turn-helix domain-containing protein [Verrucomicrobiota bacterium]
MDNIGQQLRAARERKKITLEAAAQATKIKGEHLSALEANQFDDIEAPVYVKGFIKIYARFLGIEEKPLVEAYLRTVSVETSVQLSPTPPPPPPAPAPLPKPAAPSRPTLSPRPGPSSAPLSHAPIGKTASSPQSEDRFAIPPGAIIAGLTGIIGLCVIIWAVWGFMSWAGSSHTTPKTTGTNVAAAMAARTGGAVAAQPAINPYLQPRNLTPAQIIEPAQAPVHSLTLRADETCTVTVTVDGAIWFRGKMPRNEVRKFDARRSIKIRTSDGNALHAWFNQKDAGKLGRKGEQIERQWP